MGKGAWLSTHADGMGLLNSQEPHGRSESIHTVVASTHLDACTQNTYYNNKLSMIL